MDNEDKPDWLTEMDEEILDLLKDGLVLTPSIIAENIDRSREGVANRLSALQAGDLVEKEERGKYRLGSEGQKVLFDWVEPDVEEYTEEDIEFEQKRTEAEELRDEEIARALSEYDVPPEHHREVFRELQDILKEEDEEIVKIAYHLNDSQIEFLKSFRGADTDGES